MMVGVDISDTPTWENATDKQRMAVKEASCKATVLISNLDVTGVLEVPMSILNRFVLDSCDQWDTKFHAAAAEELYGVLLEEMKMMGLSLAGRFEPRSYLLKAAEVLGYQ